MSENTVESTIKKQINSLLKVDIVRNIKLDNYRFKMSMHNEIDGFFLKNYLENNVFGYNYTILDGSRNITRIIEYENNLDIRIYNQIALMILFKHFNIDWDDNYLKDNERDTDIDKDKDKYRYYNAPFIYVKDKSGSRIPVVIITYLNDTESTSYLLLKKYYENMMQYISSTDFSSTIDDILNVPPENVELDNLGVSNIHNTIREIVSRLKSKFKKNTYIVYHLFDYRKDTHEISDTYKEPFKRTGHNKLGKYVMEELNTIVEISESESMLLKKNIDKMFNNFNTLTAVPSDSSSSSNSSSSSSTNVSLLESRLISEKATVEKKANPKAGNAAGNTEANSKAKNVASVVNSTVAVVKEAKAAVNPAVNALANPTAVKAAEEAAVKAVTTEVVKEGNSKEVNPAVNPAVNSTE